MKTTTSDHLSAVAAVEFQDVDIRLYCREGTLDQLRMEEIPLSVFLPATQEDSVLGSSVWVPTGQFANAQQRFEFRVIGLCRNCKIVLNIPRSGKIKVTVKGDNNRFMFLSDLGVSLDVRMVSGSLFVMGERTRVMGARVLLANTTLLVGMDGLWSDEIIIQGADQHSIVDLRTMEIINKGRRYVQEIGTHVWIGRRAVVLKDVKIGEGSIVGAASVVTKDVHPVSVVAGNPAKVIKSGVSWFDSSTGPSEHDSILLDKMIRRYLPNGV